MHRLLKSLVTAWIGLAASSHAGTTPPPPPKETGETVPVIQQAVTAASLVRVNATNQGYQLMRPWLKRPPLSRRGTGVVLDGNRILVTAELVMNHNFVELENPTTLERSAARVSLVDYECNLALLTPVDDQFLKDALPVKPSENLAVGSIVDVVQIESTGAVVLTGSRITTVTQSNYPVDGVQLLIYRLSVPLQYRDNSFSLPVFAGDRLAGLLMRYDARTQSADIVPDPVIRSFLDRAAKTPYESFPRLGVSVAAARDPKFRKFLGLQPEQSGLYVSSVRPNSPAEKAGILKADVLLSVDGKNLDNDGNYENPTFGKLSFAHHIATDKAPGDSITVKVFRDGEVKELTATLAPRSVGEMTSEPFMADTEPPYFILGGLVIQELSREALKEFGAEWKTNAPQRLVYLDEFQDENAEGGKIVFISQVLPSEANLGYENVGMVVVNKINGKSIQGLKDVAEAVKLPGDGFHRIEIDSDPRLIILDAAEVEKVMPTLLKTYNLPAPFRL